MFPEASFREYGADTVIDMAMRYVIGVAILFVCVNSWAQSGPNTPQFEVASIRSVAKGSPEDERGAQLLRETFRDMRQPGEIPMASPDRIRLKDWTLLDLVAAAYGVRPSQVVGPDWMEEQGFDVEATVPVGTPKAALDGMLGSLLEERFGLKAHRAEKTGRGFALMVGKGGPKLLPATPPPAKPLTEKELADQMPNQMEEMRKQMAELGETSSSMWTWPSVTMEELAARLVRYTQAPVVDATGLAGKYSVSIAVSNNGDAPGSTIFDAVGRLGLKLQPIKVTVETVVIDHVSKSPTEN
jgi:uncharacterized protein (TIGR03435 family)